MKHNDAETPRSTTPRSSPGSATAARRSATSELIGISTSKNYLIIIAASPWRLGGLRGGLGRGFRRPGRQSVLQPKGGILLQTRPRCD